MTWAYPWDFVRHIEARQKGARFELTPDRNGFHVRGVRLLPDELAYIRANRDRVLQHVQHLMPPPEFTRQRDRGWPGWHATKPRDERFIPNETHTDNRATEEREVDLSRVPF